MYRSMSTSAHSMMRQRHDKRGRGERDARCGAAPSTHSTLGHACLTSFRILFSLHFCFSSVLLSGIEKLDLDNLHRKGPSMSDLPDTRRAGALAPVTGAVDVKLVTQIKDLQDANRSLLAKFDKLSSQCRESLKEVVDLKQVRDELDINLHQARKDLSNLQSSNKSAQQSEIEQLRAELAALKESNQRQVDDLKAELKTQGETLNSKVNNAPQYQQLKKLMNTKNEQLKESRARVKQLEEHLGKSGN